MLVLAQPVLRNGLLVILSSQLRDASLAFEVDVDDAEAFLIAVCPLEVIEQAPYRECLNSTIDLGGLGSLGHKKGVAHWSRLDVIQHECTRTIQYLRD